MKSDKEYYNIQGPIPQNVADAIEIQTAEGSSTPEMLRHIYMDGHMAAPSEPGNWLVMTQAGRDYHIAKLCEGIE